MPKVNQKKCIGCGLCANICEEMFELDEKTGKSKAKNNTNKNNPCIEEAIESCPVGAIEE